ncbi:LysR family transcriptional regulator [Sinomonas sp. ASV486]|uniref:LysR family transcriptional regulator n=1 Tax=Sinomonas sp. ASV486 TaxID=3051170 RepID=UPI0027DD2930|nr:LysR family transcriptional regulator [Sinomonas sp. ASV486]MDQ4489235.1 LysR family transcriptional regulator [Sinomonas sp. ASV486]
MQLAQIEYFVAVAEALSFTRGAEAAGVVQSAVSAAIRQLEREMGAELFVRLGRSVRLSPAGEALLPRALDVLDAVQAARDAVDGVRGTARGTVALGVLAHSGNLDVPGVLRSVHRQYPEIVVKLRQTIQGTRTSLDDVRSGALDLAMVSVSEAAAPDIDLTPLHADGILFVCAPGHRLAGRRRITLADVAGEPFVDFPEGWGNRATVDAAFAAAGLGRAVRTEVVTFGMALELIRDGLGVGFVPESAFDGGALPLEKREAGELDGVWAVRTALIWKIQLARSARRRSTAAEEAVLQAFLAQGR